MNTYHLARIATIFAAVLLVSACETTGPAVPGSRDDPYVITITWKDGGSSCEVDTVTATLPNCSPPKTGKCGGRGEFIQWESAPGAIRYEVFFDPLQPSPFRSNGKGVLKRKIDDEAPFAEYKYSILRDRCDATTDTFDPRIRIDR